ncbi:MFS transporter [Novosphingobium sp. Gsoil 351]|uniref:MFS transporter n=1 Tax=Novosphingobium sp. Gsoil 351 TaxID=2675225 RepID=UPI0018A8442E|nr:MFS transporter [Novosphingobium sp. Gsoil 351]
MDETGTGMNHGESEEWLSARPNWRRWGWYGLGVVVLASIVGSVNRGLIALIAEPMKQSMALSDSEIGLLTGLALTFVTAIATYPVGWIADRFDRRWLLAGCILIWTVATVGFGFATSFRGLFLCAMGIAAGEAVLGPVTYSMIPDLFPKERWVAANFVFVTATLLGTYLGMALGGSLFGWVAANAAVLPGFVAGLEPWRATIVLSALTGPPLAGMVFVMRLVRMTPPHAKSAQSGVAAYFRENARTTVGIFFGFGLSYAAFGAQAQWNAVILQRLFKETPAQIGQFLGVFGAAAAVAGVCLAWLAVRSLRARHGDETPMLVARLALLCALVVSLPIPFASKAWHFYAVILAKIGFTFMANSLSPTVLQLMSPSPIRGRVVALGGMVTIVAASFMPWLVGLLSDHVFTGPRGIILAMAAVAIPGLAGGLLALHWGSRTLGETIARAQAREVHP